MSWCGIALLPPTQDASVDTGAHFAGVSFTASASYTSTQSYQSNGQYYVTLSQVGEPQTLHCQCLLYLDPDFVGCTIGAPPHHHVA